jgi:hypothetical protein
MEATLAAPATAASVIAAARATAAAVKADHLSLYQSCGRTRHPKAAADTQGGLLDGICRSY